MNVLITILLSVITTILTAQSNIPTLKKQLAIPTTDSCQLFYELGKEYEGVNIDSCFYFLQNSLTIARRKNDASAIARAMCRIGYTYTVRDRNDAKAVMWLNKAIEVAKKTNDNLNLAKSYQYLSYIALFQNPTHAEELMTKAMYYAKLSNDWEVVANSYDMMGSWRAKQKRYKEAEMAAFNAMTACENHNDDRWLSYGLDYCDYLEAQDRKEEAQAFSQKLNPVRSKLTKSQGDFVYMIDMGRLETKLKHYAQADSIFKHALEIEKAKIKPDSFHLLYIFRYSLGLSFLEGNQDKTFQLIEALSNIRLVTKDKRLSQDSKVKMVELKSALDLEKKELEIALLDEQKKRQQQLLIVVIVITLLLGSFMLILQRNKRRIEQQKTELAALNSTKDKLFALLSHDLLSPLANLKNIMMLVDWGMMSQEEFVVVSKKLVNNVNNLYSMFENVLHWSISQMQGIKPKFEQVNISEVVNEQITLFEPIAKSKNICIEQAISTDFVLCIDKNHLALIIRNLLQNALKFTNSGGSIVFNSQNTEGGAKLIIQDTGIGMTPDILAKLFKIDQTVKHKGTAQEGGTGVGLILTKELVIFNRGTIDVASEIGKGTTVVLQFP